MGTKKKRNAPLPTAVHDEETRAITSMPEREEDLTVSPAWGDEVTVSPTTRGVEVMPPMPALPEREEGGRWRPGTPSPNPAGRPPAVPVEVKEAARAYTITAIETLVRVMTDTEAAPAAQVAAACAVLDRGWGKPVASIEAKVATVDFGQMHLEALRALSAKKPSEEG